MTRWTDRIPEDRNRRRDRRRAKALREQRDRILARRTSFGKEVGKYEKQSEIFKGETGKFKQKWKPFVRTPRGLTSPVFVTARKTSDRYLTGKFKQYETKGTELKGRATKLEKTYSTLKATGEGLASQMSTYNVEAKAFTKEMGKKQVLAEHKFQKQYEKDWTSYAGAITSKLFERGGLSLKTMEDLGMSRENIKIAQIERLKGKQIHMRGIKSDLALDPSVHLPTAMGKRAAETFTEFPKAKSLTWKTRHGDIKINKPKWFGKPMPSGTLSEWGKEQKEFMGPRYDPKTKTPSELSKRLKSGIETMGQSWESFDKSVGTKVQKVLPKFSKLPYSEDFSRGIKIFEGAAIKTDIWTEKRSDMAKMDLTKGTYTLGKRDPYINPVTGKPQPQTNILSPSFKAVAGIGKFTEGMYEGVREKPFTTVSSLVLGKGIGFGTRAVSTGVKKGLVKLSAKGARGLATTKAVYMIGTPLTRAAKYGIMGWYGATKYAEIKSSKTPWKTAGAITSTEIIPFSLGAGLGYGAAKKVGLTRAELKAESLQRALSDPSGKTYKLQKQVFGKLVDPMWRMTTKGRGRFSIRESFPGAKLTSKQARLSEKALSGGRYLPEFYDLPKIGGSTGLGITTKGSGIKQLQADTIKVSVSPTGKASWTGEAKVFSDIDPFTMRPRKLMKIEDITKGKIKMDIHPSTEVLFKPYGQKKQIVKTEFGYRTGVAKTGEQLGGTAEGMTQVDKPEGDILKSLSYNWMRTDLFPRPKPKIAPTTKLGKIKEKAAQRMFPEGFYRRGKDLPSTTYAAENLLKEGVFVKAIRKDFRLNKAQRKQAAETINIMKRTQGEKQWGVSDKPAPYSRPSFKPSRRSSIISSISSKSFGPSISSVSKSVSVSPSISPSVSPSVSKSISPSFSPSISMPPYSPSISTSVSGSPSISPSPSPSPSPSISMYPKKPPFKGGRFIFRFKGKQIKSKEKVKTKKQRGRETRWTPSIIGTQMKPIKGTPAKKFTGAEIRRARI